ncbi:FAD-dependent monooxygenase [Profundibacter amoris]|uniref:Monooxygenase n=1 Tax=Profundibacter amoris TaxID=2171755 RepID=A0A347UH40_9RHOB|nr:FAD-dependent monooxygenase [Profundibacter amoris]AXX98168.1 monooxygenase [Profundibacter amoris]
MALDGQKICVLGAGIGGLAAATALARRGAEVTVMEQSAEIAEVGAGLQIGPNGFAVMRALGAGDALAGCSVRAEGVSLLDGVSEKPVFGLDFQRFADDQEYYFVHRADLVDVLADAARKAGVKIRLLQQVETVTVQDGHAHVVMKQGGGSSPDVLIGADGLHSRVRMALNRDNDPFFTRQVAWRTIVPAQGNEPAMARVYMGAGKHLVVYPLRDGKMLNIVAVQERDEWAAEGWNFRDDPANLRAVFADFRPGVQGLLERVEDVYLWGLFRHPVAENWHKGRVAILGDAAHPTLPFMAQGAVMALEDAWVLADALDKADTVETGLASYQTRRRPRAARVIDAASKNARNYHLSPGPLRFAAHTALRLGSTFAPSLAMKKFDWIYKHDVTRA